MSFLIPDFEAVIEGHIQTALTALFTAESITLPVVLFADAAAGPSLPGARIEITATVSDNQEASAALKVINETSVEIIQYKTLSIEANVVIPRLGGSYPSLRSAVRACRQVVGSIRTSGAATFLASYFSLMDAPHQTSLEYALESEGDRAQTIATITWEAPLYFDITAVPEDPE